MNTKELPEETLVLAYRVGNIVKHIRYKIRVDLFTLGNKNRSNVAVYLANQLALAIDQELKNMVK